MRIKSVTFSNLLTYYSKPTPWLLRLPLLITCFQSTARIISASPGQLLLNQTIMNLIQHLSKMVKWSILRGTVKMMHIGALSKVSRKIEVSRILLERTEDIILQWGRTADTIRQWGRTDEIILQWEGRLTPSDNEEGQMTASCSGEGQLTPSGNEGRRWYHPAVELLMSSGNGGEPGSDLLGTLVKKCSYALSSQSDIPFYTSHQKSRPATDSIRNWERTNDIIWQWGRRAWIWFVRYLHS